MENLQLGWYDVIGFVGVFCLLTAYAALQFGMLAAENPLYSLLNAVAAALILFSLMFTFNAASFAVEFFWLVISLVGLLRSLHVRKKAE